jgi:hypothetical protein
MGWSLILGPVTPEVAGPWGPAVLAPMAVLWPLVDPAELVACLSASTRDRALAALWEPAVPGRGEQSLVPAAAQGSESWDPAVPP